MRLSQFTNYGADTIVGCKVAIRKECAERRC